MNPTDSRPISPSDLARLQANRAAAQAWVDHCDRDLLEAQRRLDRLGEERLQASEALQARDEELRAAGEALARGRVG
jgi:hypothetical protein